MQNREYIKYDADMCDSQWTILGCLCWAGGALLALGQLWAGYRMAKIHVEPLTGLDWLDVVLRLESCFGISFTRSDFEAIPATARAVLTAGQLWDLVQVKLRATGKPVRNGGWEKVVVALAEALNMATTRIEPNSQLCADLGMQLYLGL